MKHFTLEIVATIVSLSLLFVSTGSQAGPAEQAKRIHERLTGVIPSASVLQAMEDELNNNNGEAAALIAMENEAFYSATIKNWAAPWTNRDQDVFVPLNDYIATVIGYVRDGESRDFRGILYNNIVYRSNANGLAPYTHLNNDHYEDIENNGVSLKDTLEPGPQSGLPDDATAGLMTTRAAAEAFFIDGTNRAMLRFTLLNHMCRDLEQVQDSTRPPDRIRQDVSRSPGGDSRVFLNNCVSCHSGMDPLAQAFAYYDFDNELDALVYTADQVNPKYYINESTFPYGYVTPDDGWENYWRSGQNSLLGWDYRNDGLPGVGMGAKSLGMELAHSEAFSQCQVEKVFKEVCLRDPVNASDLAEVQSLKSNFENNSYNIKQVFAETADYCKGDWYVAI